MSFIVNVFIFIYLNYESFIVQEFPRVSIYRDSFDEAVVGECL